MILLCYNIACAQKKDSSYLEKWVNSRKNVKKLLGMITREPEADLSPFLVKSEDAYLKYEGKIIRHIILKRIGFEKMVVDTSRNLQSAIAKTANRLHTNSREVTIRNNLFVREGKPLNPYRLADNERLLRNLNFIMDARIFVKSVSKNSDSVDLLVVTRDIFSLSGALAVNLPTKYQFSLQDVNFAGLGQHVQFGQVFDLNRNPHYGYEGFYQVINIKGSFVDASLGYTNLNSGVSTGHENENSFYFKLSRALYQPFARLAGAIELSDNVSKNVFKKPDSIFAQYSYRVQDYWLGYSFGYKKLPNDLQENRKRKFIALRGFEQNFRNVIHTELTEPDRFVYRNIASVLAQLTFFRQDFYKTQYVLGFGRTEDIPYGYRISFTMGLEKELGIKRPYLGSELFYNIIRPTGTILSYSTKIATYVSNRKTEDVFVSLDFTRYSKIYRMGKMIVRHQSIFGYAALVNQSVKRGVDIRDGNGILGFMPDSLVGFQRATISQEVTMFTPWKMLGFRMAPVARVDLALIKITKGLFQAQNFFSGFSLGLRARNENLIFNTVEARLFYYPKIVERIDHFRFNITTNFRIRYSTNLVNKPSTVFQ
ncbi:hypothetical protein WSM22_45840 [Cytophagales bacterium WSM2-2]|nr:hypothetical protein WSM22_45840 [Cytophagales bacterium WSM2-2]